MPGTWPGTLRSTSSKSTDLQHLPVRVYGVRAGGVGQDTAETGNQ
ncbi:hypothetical protein [Micromonospora sp. NPDC005413]